MLHLIYLFNHVQGKLFTQDKIEKWQKRGNLLCGLCKNISDSHDHLFFQCKYAMKVWKGISSLSFRMGRHYRLEDLINDMVRNHMENSFGTVVDKLILAATVYYIGKKGIGESSKMRKELRKLHALGRFPDEKGKRAWCETRCCEAVAATDLRGSLTKEFDVVSDIGWKYTSDFLYLSDVCYIDALRYVTSFNSSSITG
ncbi:RNA-directed DNA polymerase, eukaryota, reverse transcriptase zinc-binding domain protein [Tanacetum coccineum]